MLLPAVLLVSMAIVAADVAPLLPFYSQKLWDNAAAAAPETIRALEQGHYIPMEGRIGSDGLVRTDAFAGSVPLVSFVRSSGDAHHDTMTVASQAGLAEAAAKNEIGHSGCRCSGWNL